MTGIPGSSFRVFVLFFPSFFFGWGGGKALLFRGAVLQANEEELPAIVGIPILTHTPFVAFGNGLRTRDRMKGHGRASPGPASGVRTGQTVSLLFVCVILFGGGGSLCFFFFGGGGGGGLFEGI